MALFVSLVFACVSFVIRAYAVKLMKIYHFSIAAMGQKKRKCFHWLTHDQRF